MKIADSNVLLNAQHSRTEYHQSSERLSYWRGDSAPTVTENTPSNAPQQLARAQGVQLELSYQAASMKAHSGEISAEDGETTLDAQAQFEVSLLKLLVEQITGRRIKVIDPGELSGNKRDGDHAGPPRESRNAPPERASAGFGLRYEYHEIHHESEQTRFSAEGVARTEDGREINFNVSLNMSREFTEETHLQITAGDAVKDPLVLNFNGNAAQLTQRDFAFDIDLDGHADQIAFVGAGSGFLALDRNGDGEINDGRELFGPQSGDGFAELATYDSDGNNWIDENDPVFERLRIWSRDAAGQTHLSALGAKGVGAIYLGHVSTPFEVNTSDNEQLGQVRSSGVFLEESGQVGTVQQLDLVV